jgi:hypothetical protein
MNLALATRSIFRRIDAFDRARPHRRAASPNDIHRSNVVRMHVPQHPPRRLAARWHLAPETGRLECRWSLEDAPADDQSCQTHGTMRTSLRDRTSSRRRLAWRLDESRGRPSQSVGRPAASPEPTPM